MGCQILATLADSKGSSLVGDIIPGRGHHQIDCLAFFQAPTAPRDPSHHSLTGRRVYEPFKIYTVMGPAIPLLYLKQRQNEVLSSVVLTIYPSYDLHSVPSHIIRLTDATVSKIASHSLAGVMFVPGMVRAGKVAAREYLEIDFVYGGISWTYKSGGKGWDDNWSK